MQKPGKMFRVSITAAQKAKILTAARGTPTEGNLSAAVRVLLAQAVTGQKARQAVATA